MFLEFEFEHVLFYLEGISLEAFYNKHIIPEAKSHIIDTIRGNGPLLFFPEH
jgi:hypothetical protein